MEVGGGRREKADGDGSGVLPRLSALVMPAQRPDVSPGERKKGSIRETREKWLTSKGRQKERKRERLEKEGVIEWRKKGNERLPCGLKPTCGVCPLERS